MFLVILKIICILCQCNGDNVFFPVETETFLGDSCHKHPSGIKGICRLISECASAKENLSIELRTQICGFKGNDPLICCIDDVPSNVETIISNVAVPLIIETFTSNITTPSNVGTVTSNITVPSKVETVTSSITTPSNVETFISNINSTRKLLPLVSRQEKQQRISLQKCLEYKNRVYSDDICPYFNESVKGYGVVPAEKHPYFALVGYEFLKDITWACPGELLSELYVLTLDSCLNSFVYGPPKFVRLGGNLSIPSDYDEKQVQVINVQEAIKYPTDLSERIYNRIALLKLGKPAVLNRFIVPICLPTSENVEGIITSTDWRYYYREKTEEFDTHLREVEMVVVPTEKCKETHGGEVQDIHMCARIRNRTEYQCAAKGGLIAPHSEIQCMYSLIGFEVVSSGCQAGLYSRVTPYLSWLEKTVWPQGNQ